MISLTSITSSITHLPVPWAVPPVAAATLALLGAYCWRRHLAGQGRDVVIPLPERLRDDLHFGYYYAADGQLPATREHTSIVWWVYGGAYSLAQLQADLLAARAAGRAQKLVVDAAWAVVQWNPQGRSAAHAQRQERLRALLQQLDGAGLLGDVAAIVPCDEPNSTLLSAGELALCVSCLRAEIARWPALAGCRLACIYGYQRDELPQRWHLDAFDIVGIDHYAQKSSILTEGDYAQLLPYIAAHQQTILLPGAAYGQDPAPFVAYAHAHPEVWAVVPFLWGQPNGETAFTGLVSRPAAEQARYAQAGRLALGLAGIGERAHA